MNCSRRSGTLSYVFVCDTFINTTKFDIFDSCAVFIYRVQYCMSIITIKELMFRTTAQVGDRGVNVCTAPISNKVHFLRKKRINVRKNSFIRKAVHRERTLQLKKTHPGKDSMVRDNRKVTKDTC